MVVRLVYWFKNRGCSDLQMALAEVSSSSDLLLFQTTVSIKMEGRNE